MKQKAALISWLRRIYASLPGETRISPVFIVGCGRSGTSALGELLARHHDIVYLHEPRQLWAVAYPETDIWSADAVHRGGKLVLAESDEKDRSSRRIRRLFDLEIRRRRGTLLVEKLPANSFRLAFLQAAFPRARFVHLYRNGIEVARSIAAQAAVQPWYGIADYKWDRLVSYAREHRETADLVGLCKSDYLRGLFEWRLSTGYVVSFLRSQSDDIWYELSYDQLMRQAKPTVTDLLAFLGVVHQESLSRTAKKMLRRRSDSMEDHHLTDIERRIGGPLLPRSMGAGGLVADGPSFHQ